MSDTPVLTKFVSLDALVEAREMVAYWGGYASPFFKERYNLAGNLAKLDAVIAAAHEPNATMREALELALPMVERSDTCRVDELSRREVGERIRAALSEWQTLEGKALHCATCRCQELEKQP